MKKEDVEDLFVFEEAIDPRLCIRQLDNGFSYWIRPHHKAEHIAKIQLVFRVGSIFERDDQQGLAHILEHMAFHGSQQYSKEEIERFFAQIGMSFGAHVNAQTGFEKTIYMIEVPTDQPEEYQRAFAILRDWCSNLLLEEVEIEKERKIGIEEYRQALSGMWRVKKQLLPKMYLGGKQVERLPIGTKESLEGFAPEALRAFYRDWYQPRFAGLIVTGDVDVSETSQLIETLFSDWQNTNDYAPVESTLDREHENLWISLVDQEVPYPICGIVQKQKIDPRDSREAYFQRSCFAVLEDILNQRFAFLTRDPECELHHVYCGMQELSLDTEAVFLQATFRQGAAKQGIYRFIQELRAIRQFGVQPEEVERSKARLIEMFQVLAVEEEKLPLRYFSSDLLDSFLRKEPVLSLQSRYRLEQELAEAISPERLNQLIQTLLPPLSEKQGVVFQYVAPVEQQLTIALFQQYVAEAMTLPVEAPKITENNKTLLNRLPTGEERIAERYYEKYALTEWRYANGARVWLKPTVFQEQQIRFQAIGQGGYCWATEQQIYSAKQALDIAHYSGAGDLSADELDLIMNSPKLSMNFHVSDYYHSISGYAFPDTVEKIWQYFWLRTQQQQWKESALKKVLEWKHTQLENRDNDPNRIFSRLVRHTLWDHHPRKQVLTQKDLDAVQLSEASEFFDRVFRPVADMTYIFVGAFTLEEIEPVINRYIGGLPAATRRERSDSGERMFSGRRFESVQVEQEEKAKVHLTWLKREAFSPMARFAFNYLRIIFEERLRKELRENLGGTYHVHVSGGFRHYPEAVFVMEASFSCEPNRVDELKTKLLDMLDILQEQGVTQEELDVTTTKISRQLDQDEQEDRYWLSLFSNAVKRGKGISDIFDIRQAMEDLSLSVLQECIEQLLSFEDTMEVLLLPQEREESSSFLVESVK